VGELSFEIVAATAEAYSVTPTINLELRIGDPDGGRVEAVALRAQVRIEPQRRRYTGEESARLFGFFGEPAQWGESLRPFQWTQVAATVGAFVGTAEVSLPIACTYDFEVTGASYLNSLEDGEIPLVVLFNGTIFTVVEDKMRALPIPWHLECRYRLPVALWRETMDRYFPDSAWLRLARPTLDSLTRYRDRQALTTWEATLERLLKEAGEEGA
jgi:hypothetical protein